MAQSPPRRSNSVIAAEREAAVMRLLERGTQTCAELAGLLGLEPAQLNSTLVRLRGRDEVVLVETRQVGKARVPVYGRRGAKLPATRAPEVKKPARAPRRAPERPVVAPEAVPVPATDPVAEMSLTRRYAEVLIIALEQADELDEPLMDRIERILGVAG